MNGTRFEFHPPYANDVEVERVVERGRILIVHDRARQAYDLWVGSEDERQRMAVTNTFGICESLVDNFRLCA